MQLVVQMQTQMADGPATTNILYKPEHILTFVKHVLDSVIASSPQPQPSEVKATKVGIGLNDLRIVDDEVEEEERMWEARRAEKVRQAAMARHRAVRPPVHVGDTVDLSDY